MTQKSNYSENSQNIAKRQYLQPGEQTIEDRFLAVARTVSDAESNSVDKAFWGDKFYDLMADKKFCPGGRILAGAGTPHGQLLNCFVQAATDNNPASLDGIIELAVKLALVTQKGGGNGLNLDVFEPQSVFTPMSGPLYSPMIRSSHGDAETFRQRIMTPPNMPDSPKVPTRLKRATDTIFLSDTQDALGSRIIRVPDDLEGIIRAGGEMMKMILEQKATEPIWVDFSAMRPEGDPIKGTGGASSGPFPFVVEIFDNFAELAARGGEKAGPINILRYAFAPVLRVVKQAGVRRGAGMATISINNPHILDFITCKDLDREAAEGDISTFNISILVTEEFWRALEADQAVDINLLGVPGKYDLNKIGDENATPSECQNGYHVKASWLWNQIAEHAWSTGEPGLIFVDRLNEMSALKNLGPDYEIRATNPCGEVPLTVGEPCDLGAINLAAYVVGKSMFSMSELLNLQPGQSASGSKRPAFDWDAFKADIPTFVRFLDDVLDVNNFPLEQNRNASHNLRRLGLGVMGMADMLVKLGLRYDSQEGRDFVFKVMDTLRAEAIKASEELGRERGVYPLYDKMQGDYGESVGEDYTTKVVIPHAPRRNVALLTVAPTGTTSMVFDVSSGLEPIFSLFVWRKVGSDYVSYLHELFVEMLGNYNPDGSMAAYIEGEGIGWDWDKVKAALEANHGSVQGLNWVPQAIRDAFVTAHDVTPLDHVRMQGAVQRAFDNGGYAGNSLSKTINLPNAATVDDVKSAYEEAYKTGCKGITVYRDGSRQFQVLSTSKDDAEATPEAADEPSMPYYQEVAEVMLDPTKAEEVLAKGPEGQSLQTYLAAALSTAEPAVPNATPPTRRLRELLATVDYDAAVEAIDEFWARTPRGGPTDEDAAIQRIANIAVNGDPAAEVREFAGLAQVIADAVPFPFKRPERLIGSTDSVKVAKLCPDGKMENQSYLVTVNRSAIQGVGFPEGPVEVVLTAGKAGDETNADAEAMGRLTSLALQYGVPAKEIIRTLRGINGGLMGRYAKRGITSKADLIAVGLERALEDGELWQSIATEKEEPVAGLFAPDRDFVHNIVREPVPLPTSPVFRPSLVAPTLTRSSGPKHQCGDCGGEMIRRDGCLMCMTCGNSRCG